MHIFKKAFLFLTILILLSILVLSTKHPSHDRDWATDQAILPHVTISGTEVQIEHFRDFSYTSTSEYTPRYKTKTVDTREIVSLDYLVEPFGEMKGAAHTLLSFGFQTASGTDYVAVSVEIRKEKGESFSPLKGLLREYELMYVVGSEDDLIQLRTNFRKDDVYLYPIKTTKDRMAAIFLSMMERIAGIEHTPEFYNTMTNNCTSNIRDHVNTVVEDRVPWTTSVFLPGYSDKRAYGLGLIDTALSFEEARAHFYITDIAAEATDDMSFSDLIRSRR
ncbi:MAG: hypothetical protein CO030_02905 [Candidatus Magasanikbacteria bacterium CG_4_9_14_0_2_um_filter_42_11]|uniref:Lnb N-terminal periplasmic domain-containing protein n=1 Tax=Candidatus Magasanikbacteria bacterium CG_4_9_14_0_2_um_filter_42_11 TaxID=1974643 RepID=A0A2M8F9M6_9BACT|nr:MAG: hypothetical protein COU34_02635 [Candidatus Magasanikbacteria bacterium CG10_big_fil_rev_8_21_14_0_10_43_9]PJC52421.1 MAG: hypothetical protein CO030_02905 [Candidatus Magasanikbacteria bacterium CG_4_9_14_0_2_um_filter_42_11]